MSPDSQEAVDHARALGDPHSLAHAFGNACLLHQLGRDRQAIGMHADALIVLSAEQEFRFWLAVGTIMQGWAMAQGQQAEAGIESIRRGLDDYWATGATLWSPNFLALLAEVHAPADRATVGLGYLDDALDRVERTEARWFEAELHRLKGRLLSSLADHAPGEPEACFLRAIGIAKHQQGRTPRWRAKSVHPLIVSAA